MGEVGCYTLDLYCDVERPEWKWGHPNMPDTYTGRTPSQCRRDARKDRWEIDTKTGKCRCPECVAMKRELAPSPADDAEGGGA